MSPPLDDPDHVLEHEDLVRPQDRAEAMGHGSKAVLVRPEEQSAERLFEFGAR